MKSKNSHEESSADNISTVENGDGGLNAFWGKDLPGKLYKSWPRVNGNPEEPVFLSHCTSLDMQDDMLVNMLQAYGIPALKKYPFAGSFGKVVMGMSGDGSDIFVPASMLEDAKALMGGKQDE